jgi:hypothetical protein
MGLFGLNDGDAARLARIERKLDALLAQLNVAVPGDDMDDIRDLVAAGKKIAAIKEYRARTGAGLAEAKKAIEEGI